jgi:hypothetical protein
VSNKHEIRVKMLNVVIGDYLTYDNKHSPVGCTRRQAGKGLDRKNPPWSDVKERMTKCEIRHEVRGEREQKKQCEPLNSRPELLCSDDDIPAEWYMSGSRGDAIPCEFSQQQA